MKYIMMETEDGKRMPFVFPESVVHLHMAVLIKALMDLPKMPVKCVSAGFVSGIGLGLTTHGESESIGVASDPVDAAYIALGEAVARMPPELMPALLAQARQHFKE